MAETTDMARHDSLRSELVKVDVSRNAAIMQPGMLKLPTEMLLKIVVFLSTTEKAALILSCKHLLKMLGSGSLAELKGSDLVNLLEHFEVNVPKQMLCPSCQHFHPMKPSWIGAQLQMIQCLLGWRDRPIDGSCVAFTSQLNLAQGLPKLSWAIVYEVMKRHRLGPEHGVDIDILNMVGYKRNPQMRREWSWKITSTPRIRDNHLVVKVHCVLTVVKGRDGRLVTDALSMLGPLMCSHTGMHTVEQQIKLWFDHLYKDKRAIAPCDTLGLLDTFHCKRCGCVYHVGIRPLRKGELRGTLRDVKRILYVEKYLDLGECRATRLAKWRRLASIDDEVSERDRKNAHQPMTLWNMPEECEDKSEEDQ